MERRKPSSIHVCLSARPLGSLARGLETSEACLVRLSKSSEVFGKRIGQGEVAFRFQSVLLDIVIQFQTILTYCIWRLETWHGVGTSSTRDCLYSVKIVRRSNTLRTSWSLEVERWSDCWQTSHQEEEENDADGNVLSCAKGGKAALGFINLHFGMIHSTIQRQGMLLLQAPCYYCQGQSYNPHFSPAYYVPSWDSHTMTARITWHSRIRFTAKPSI